MRPSKVEYYLDIAETVADRSTCLRRKYGAIIVKNDVIIATGYNGAPRKQPNCIDLGYCKREEMQIKKGERYELCRAVHAEQNAMLACSRENMLGSTLYIVGLETDEEKDKYALAEPCLICRKLIMNSGIEKVIGRENQGNINIDVATDWEI